MSYCDHPNCSTTRIKALHSAHSFLCSKSKHYHSWHHHKNHKHVHRGILAVYIVAIIGLLISNIIGPIATHAASATWNINTAGDYTYDDTKVEFTGGVAQLKTAYTAGTDWIATDGGGNNWNYRKKITFDNSAQAENIVDFPALVKLDKDIDIDYLKTQDSGQDIRFTDSDGKTVLPHEIERWDETGISYVWTKVPQIDASSNTDYIYMYYGNSTVADGQQVTSVWDSGFLGVWHNNETGATTQDSTSNDKDGTKTADGHPAPIAGQIYNGQNFLGDDRVGTTINNALTDFTVEVWYKDNGVSDNGGYERLADKSYTGCFWFGRNSTAANSWGGGVRQGSAPYGIFVTLTDGQWHQVTSLRSGSMHYVYGDGGSVSASENVGNTACDNTNFAIGGYGDGTANQRFGGVIDEVRLSSTARSQKWLAASYKSGKDTFNTIDANPTTLYPTTSPTLVPNTAQGYSSLSAFSDTLGSGSAGTIKYQISPDGGATWYRYNSGWVTTVAGYTESNTSAEINSNISTFTAGSDPKTFKWRAYLNSDGSQLPKLDSIALTYIWDTGNPNNVSAFTSAKSQADGGVDLGASDGSVWYSYPTPSFSWANPGDTANDGETESGISTYYICFNTNETCHPVNEGTSQSGTTYTASNLVSGQTYYFRIRTKDNAGNYSSAENQLFTYKYDGTKPDNPHYVSASPSGFSSSKNFTFTWPTSTSAAAEDTGGSNLLGYQYKINSDTVWYGSSHTGVPTDVIPYGTGTIALTEEDQELVTQGTNTFYLRTLDNAGNITDTTIQVPFYFNNSAPKTPTGLTVEPKTNTTNSFSFRWNAPENPTSPIVGYYYAVNPTLPLTVGKASYTEENSLPADDYANQEENFLYVVAKDEAGNANLASCDSIQNNPETDGCARVSFTANTPAPGIPTGVLINDQSIRGVAYKVSLSWNEPEQVGIGIAKYNIYRKSGSDDYVKIDSSVVKYYLDDTVQPGIEYFYKIKSVDSTDKESASSSVVNITPKGRYESPARVEEGSIKVVTTSRTASISWGTETNRDPFTNDIHTTDSTIAYGKTQALEATAATITKQTSSHLIPLDSLEPDTLYYYKILGRDEDGNQTEGDVLTFQTEKPTLISNVETLEIRQNTAIVRWISSRITTTKILYGKTESYGLTYDEGNTPNATTHPVSLKDLDPGTTYNFKIQGLDQFGDTFVSDNYTFTTLEYPRIENITFQPIKTAATTTIEVAWTTNVETDGKVQFASTDGADWREEYNGAFKKDHKFTIGAGKLLDQKTYLFKASVRDRYTNEATSENQSYTTPEDTRPPVVTNLQTEVSIEGSGDSAKVSAIVTWDTDEPADSQVFYGAGTSGDYSNSTGKDGTMVTSHLVVLSDLKAAQTYHVKAVSLDKSGNSAESPAQNFVTNQASQSVVNIILTRLQQTFGWMTSFNKLFGG